MRDGLNQLVFHLFKGFFDDRIEVSPLRMHNSTLENGYYQLLADNDIIANKLWRYHQAKLIYTVSYKTMHLTLEKNEKEKEEAEEEK